MSKLLVCQYQKNKVYGFFAYNDNTMFVWDERIEKDNLYAVVKNYNGYQVVKVIGHANCMVDQIGLDGTVIELLEIDEEKINANYYSLKEEN